MTDGQGKLGPSRREPPGYTEERRRDTLARVRAAALFAVLPIVATAAVNVGVFSDHLTERLATFVTEAAVCLVAFVVTRRPGAEARAIPLAVGFVLSIGAALLWALSLSPHDLDVLVGTVAGTMIATALLFPWGAASQGIVSALLALGYLALPPWSELEATRIVNILIVLTDGVALSVVGAFVLDRHRRETFRRSTLHREEAEISAALLHVTETLNASLDRPDMLEEVTRLTVGALGCDWSSIYVWDERRRAFMLRANTGACPEKRAEVEQIEFSPDCFPIVDAGRPGEVGEIPDCSQQALISPELMRRWEIASLLGTPICRGGTIVGSLIAGYRHRKGPFSVRQRRLVLGVARATTLALENARLVADLQTANRLKSEFVSTMSHELRTPLHVILGFAQMARDSVTGADDRDRCLGRVEAAGRELLGLIESTLEVGKLEAGREDVQLERVSLPTFWAELAAGCALLPRRPEVALEWDEHTPDITLLTDPYKLTIVIRNLVGNAVKFTERGWVRVEVALEAETMVLSVADTGIGIRPEDHDKVFELFRQADQTDTRRYGGTGLGLYIVRRFVRQLGGSIVLSSASGRGSVFTVRLPSAAEASPVRSAA